MGGSNLPPGVSVNDIPGNRLEDLAEEHSWEALEDRFTEKHPDYSGQIHLLLESENEDALIAVVTMARDMGYEAGGQAALADAAMAEAYRQSEH